MKKGIVYLIWLVFVISCPAFSIISKELSEISKNNYNSTGVIIYRKYEANLAVKPNIIKTYGYIQNTVIEKQEVNNSDADSYKNVNMLFALIPKTYNCVEPDLSHNKIQCMNEYLNKNYRSKTITYHGIKDTAIINKETELFSKDFNNYLTEKNLTSIFSAEKKSQISNAILGSYGLFMPTNIDMLSKFNGIGRVLSSAVSIIDDLLLTTNDFNNNQQDITKQQFANLQALIFKAIEQAKTVVFIPECIAQKQTNSIGLPLALINKVSVDETTGQVTLNLMFCNQAINDFIGFYKFINARNSLLASNNLVSEWEFVDYTLDLTTNTETDAACSNNNLITLGYKLTSIEGKLTGCINYQAENTSEAVTTDIPTFTDETHLLSECRAPTNAEIQLINSSGFNHQAENTSESVTTDIPTFTTTEPNLLNECRQPTDAERQLINNSRIINSTTDNTEAKLEENIANTSVDSYYYSCTTYDRKCLVKFDCSCTNYWCCHLHHNSKDTPNHCKFKNFKARDIKKLKCLICDCEQDFNANTSHSCTQCKIKFSDYYCGICKHLTNRENNPEHCEKCGVCRNHSNKRFHCDDCGVCLDIRYKGKHKCLPDAEHSECGVCLEGVFKGCIVLKCGHKIHSACFNSLKQHNKKCLMKCPICRTLIDERIRLRR
jgi:RING finger/CHY zinc finger protein 1